MGVDDPTQHKCSFCSSCGGCVAGSCRGVRCIGSCGGGGGGGGGSLSEDGKTSKKIKQKKVPQRGLGVAQLEKIIFEEQAKDVVNHNTNNNSPSMSAIQGSRQNHPFPSSTNSLYRQASSAIHPNLDYLGTPVPLPLPKPVAAGEIGWRSVTGFGPGIWPGLWNDESNLETERHNNNNGSMIQDPKGGLPIHHPTMASNLSLDSVWPLMQRTQQMLLQQRPSSSSSMVKVPYGISSSPAINFPHYQYHHHHPPPPPMEPPSNQNFYGSSTINDYTSFWPEEEKIVGMKRPYPFSLDNQSGPSFRIKYPPPPPPPPQPPSLPLPLPLPLSLPIPLPQFVSTMTRSDESAALPILDSSNLVVRDKNSPSFKDIKKQIQAGSRVDNGSFLSLAPPSSASPNHTEDMPIEMDYLQSHGGGGGEEMGTRQRQQFYNFFPCEMAPSDDPSGSIIDGGQSSSSSSDGGGGGKKGKNNGLDLHLKL